MTVPRRSFVTGIGVGLMGVVGGCISTSEDSSNQQTQQGTDSEGDSDGEDNGGDDVIIEDHSFEVIEEYESDAVSDTYGVVGTASNQSDTRLDILIEVRFYDSDNTQISDSNASANGVASGSSFEFEAMYLDDNPDDVENYEIGWEAYES